MRMARQKGWIGVDVGTRTVKLAQVERVDAELRLCEAAVIQRRLPIDVNDVEEMSPVSSEQEIRTALSVGKRFSGRKAACILSMCSCDLRTLDVPLGSETEQRLAIVNQMNSAYSSGNAEREFDFWQTRVPSDEPRSDPENVAVLSVSQQWVGQVSNDLRRAGLRCTMLDGLPLALARLIQMVPLFSDREPVAAVDWGFARTTFFVVSNGRPVFVRNLRGSGLSPVTRSLRETLGVSLDEAQRLLTRHGLPDSPRGEQTRDELQVVIGNAAAEPLNAIVHELNRTLSFLKGQHPRLLPNRVWLFGGGAVVRNITGFLGAKIGIPVDVWRLESAGIQKQAGVEYPSGILAHAIAASSLAWVQQ